MLPSFGPRVTISANTSAGLRHHASRPPASSDAARSRRSRPPLAPGCSAASTLAQPTRKSLDGIKAPDQLLRTDQLLDDSSAVLQTLPVAADGTTHDNSAGSSAAQPAAHSNSASSNSISHSVSAASLSSESDLALLLSGGASEAADGTAATPLVFGSFPPVLVVATTAAAATEAQQEAEPHQEEEAAASTKLKPTSHEFYPQAYLAAAAATALAARTISSSIVARSASPPAAAPAEDQAPAAPAAAATETAAEEVSVPAAATAAEEPAPVQADAYAYDSQPQEQQYWSPQEQQGSPDAQQQQWAVVQQHQHQQHQQWHEQQQYWHYWQQQQQTQAQGPQQQQQQMVPVLVPVYVQPYPYGHYMMHQPTYHVVPTDAGAGVAGPQQHMPLQPQQSQQQVCPPSPGGFSLPADTCSLMSASTPAATPTGWQQHPMGPSPYSSSRPGSSAGSVISTFSSVSRRQRQQSGDQAGTVTVSAMSCVKDAAGALAKVVTRHNNCLLLSLAKPGEPVAQATHVAAKSLAVARFYVNAHMAAAGAAGIDAAAALTGVEQQQGAESADAASADSAAASPAADAAANDEVVFMPYQRSSSGGSRRPSVDLSDVPLGFMVAKASARDLPVLLPPPVGIPACMQDRVQQQGQRAASASSSGASSSSTASTTTLLKAGANTDVNKLSNAVIHNILGSGHVAMQLAGAAACHVAMRSLIKARDRLLRKFNTDIVATASFANEDTSSSIGRSTVFLRLDVMRSNLLQTVAAAGAAVSHAVEGQQQQQAQFAGASA